MELTTMDLNHFRHLATYSGSPSDIEWRFERAVSREVRHVTPSHACPGYLLQYIQHRCTEQSIPLSLSAFEAEDPLFRNDLGREFALSTGDPPYHPFVAQQMTQKIRKLIKRAELANVTPISMRNTFIKQLLDAGVAPEIIPTYVFTHSPKQLADSIQAIQKTLGAGETLAKE